MTPRSLWYGSRLGDVLPWGGVSLLGASFASGGLLRLDPARAALAVLSVLGLALFAFVVNDLFDRSANRREARSDRPLASGEFPAGLAYGLAGFGAAFPLVSSLLLGDRLSLGWSLVSLALGAAYSAPGPHLKCHPWLAWLVHLFQGTLGFALPAGMVRAAFMPSDLLCGLWFGLLFAGGHLHHQAIDAPDDEAAGTRTLAVRRGVRTALWLGFAQFALAAAWALALALSSLTPSGWIWAQSGPYLAYLIGFAFAARSRPDPARLRLLRSIYRTAYLTGGAALLVLSGIGASP
jgi:4-hydroxybenzoate polyprenyltransferase